MPHVQVKSAPCPENFGPANIRHSHSIVVRKVAELRSSSDSMTAISMLQLAFMRIDAASLVGGLIMTQW